MNAYTVKIFRDGQHVDTQTVRAENIDQAQKQAMLQTRVMMRGALVSYEVERV